MDTSVTPEDDSVALPASGEPANSYDVRVEYPALAYATVEIEAESPQAAIERARELDENNSLSFDLDHLTFRERLSFFVADAEEENGAPFLVRRDRRERLADAAEHLIDALQHLVGTAVFQVERLRNEADRSGDADDIAAWIHADQATLVARRWIERLR